MVWEGGSPVKGFDNPWAGADKLVRARVARSDIQMLAKLVEGLGHLGVVTTIDKDAGEVLIQTTNDAWQDLKWLILHMPLRVEFLEEF